MLICQELARSPRCGAQARRLVEEQLRAMLSGGALDDVKTVTSELANDAFEHTQGRMLLCVQLHRHGLRVELHADDHRPEGTPQTEHESLGLQIVRRISQVSGFDSRQWCRWAELRIDP